MQKLLLKTSISARVLLICMFSEQVNSGFRCKGTYDVIFPQDHKMGRHGTSLKQSPCLCFERYRTNIYVACKFFLELFFMHLLLLKGFLSRYNKGTKKYNIFSPSGDFEDCSKSSAITSLFRKFLLLWNVVCVMLPLISFNFPYSFFEHQPFY